MSDILVLSGSPSTKSRTEAVLGELSQRLREHGHRVVEAPIRRLPANALVAADSADGEVRALIEAVSHAEGILVASPIYKASYTGLLKSFLDLLPQHGLTGKTVLPLATGGTPAHVLAIDYAFRPMLHSLGAEHVVPGYFLLDRLIEVSEDGVRIDAEAEQALMSVVDYFASALHRRARYAEAS
ncbi:FMN reductase [Tamaricihabitans halophyticus]|uniref:FMN reductase n=1 Tax=Tamaricihabitans halophyticus TaxID=1262583 RepID=A0A4R2QPB0_9PSEU|nr:NADPH-dependent FMN reductase [Tamaricihabitans halophyticus]TCP50769.1 FMN reductase [Tamaricihabitans halophyticus]